MSASRPNATRRGRTAPPFLVLALLGALLALFPTAALAAEAAPTEIHVSSRENAGPGTLRAAIELANSRSGVKQEILLEVGGTIALTSALPPIEKTVEIFAPGGPEANAVSRVASAPAFPVFTIAEGAIVNFVGFTISGGESAVGGGIRNSGGLTLSNMHIVGNRAVDSGGAVAKALGGGIYSSGGLKLQTTLVEGNRAYASAGSGSTEAAGGGINAQAGATVWHSTIANNLAEANSSQGNVVAVAGGIEMENGLEKIEVSTISNNAAFAAGGSPTTEARGGGLLGEPDPIVTGSTIVENGVSAAVARGANVESGGAAHFADTIIARPSGAASCAAPLGSEGFNLDEDGSCGLRQPSDLSHVEPGLAPGLEPNEGLTPTFALLPGAAALDKGNAFGQTADQRGKPRPAQSPGAADAAGGDGSDIGSYELEGNGADTTPPQTILDATPPRTVAPPAGGATASTAIATATASFVFHAPELGARFQCKLDRGRYRGCRAPFHRKVGAGGHAFSVRAIDAAGNVDRTPARYRFRVRSR